MVGSNTLDADAVTMTLQSSEQAITDVETHSLDQVREEAREALSITQSEMGSLQQQQIEDEVFSQQLNNVDTPQGPFSSLQRAVAALVAVPVLIYKLCTQVEAEASTEAGR